MYIYFHLYNINAQACPKLLLQTIKRNKIIQGLIAAEETWSGTFRVPFFLCSLFHTQTHTHKHSVKRALSRPLPLPLSLTLYLYLAVPLTLGLSRMHATVTREGANSRANELQT